MCMCPTVSSCEGQRAICSNFSFHYLNYKYRTQAIRRGRELLYLLTHLASPIVTILECPGVCMEGSGKPWGVWERISRVPWMLNSLGASTSARFCLSFACLSRASRAAGSQVRRSHCQRIKGRDLAKSPRRLLLSDWSRGSRDLNSHFLRRQHVF